MAQALLRIGAHADALTVAREITDPYLHATTLSALAVAVGPHEAEPIVREITYPYYRVRALAQVMRATSDPRQAYALLADARTWLPAVDPDWQLSAHTELVRAGAALGVAAVADLVAAARDLAEAAKSSAVHELAVAVGLGQHHPAAASPARSTTPTSAAGR
ncbi:hypothetical protein BBK82_32690 [Lentzea guizhouensis]|uniref:Uncharacterized protein n=1 Tax=Lentzea guizhouensis TaxID=1586287 RepID=A0A1B2HQT4_9PSEU|nr:hypothetical protein [Lentzea guizhouensis]ANZ40090.1 hypothetical protein BBK82_32690 [Lentzea guizhouensis]